MSTARQIAIEFTRDRFPGAFSVTEDAVFEEPDGATTVYLQQTHRDVPVHLSRVVVRVDDGAPSAVSGRPIEVPPELSVTPHRSAVTRPIWPCARRWRASRADGSRRSRHSFAPRRGRASCAGRNSAPRSGRA